MDFADSIGNSKPCRAIAICEHDGEVVRTVIYFYDLLPCSTGSKTRSRSYRVHCVRRCADCFRRDEDRCGRHRKRQPQCAGQLPHRVVARHHSRPYPDGHPRRAGPSVRGAQFGAGRGGRVPLVSARRKDTTADSRANPFAGIPPHAVYALLHGAPADDFASGTSSRSLS